MKRCEVENKSFEELRAIIICEHSLTRANDLIQREESLIYGRLFKEEYRKKVSLEAAKRVLSGYDNIIIIEPKLCDFKDKKDDNSY